MKLNIQQLRAPSSIWQDLPLRIKGPIVIALPLTILLLSLLSLYLHEKQAAILENKLRVALQNQRDIQAVHTQLVEASTSVRDYLLTGEKSFLGIYFQANKNLDATLNKLEVELEDEEQITRLSRIKPLVNKNLADLAQLASSNLEIDNTTLVRQFSVQGKTLNNLRTLIEEMGAREAKLVADDQKQVNYERQRNINLTIISALAGILGTLASAWVFSRTIVKRVQLIRDSAAHLARGEALALPSISQDELGQLAHELDQAAQLLSNSMYEANLAKLQAQEANAEKSIFLSRTSHELRTPLNAILGFAHLLETDLTDLKQKESLSMISAAGKHLLKLIDQVLDIARIESGDMQIDIQPCDISALLDEATHFMHPLAKARDIQIKTYYPPDLVIATDRQRLLQIVLNLISNALKYGPANAKVYMQAYKKDDKVIIEVADEGKGIPKSMHHRVFTPFERLGAENTKVEGVGLGLALSNQMMAALGGEINIASDKSLFQLTLPYKQLVGMPKPAIDEPSALNSISLRHQAKILYVEDNPSNRALIEAIIARNANFHLYAVSTIQEAKIFLVKSTPDIALIDLNLPDGSGVNLVEHIQNHAHHAHIPILILSADATRASIGRLKRMGVYEYFTKPLDIAAFNQTLNKLLNSIEKNERKTNS
ncbi:ATP-binding protein [Methylotenera mobilis]|uniref:histidine kinase n=1 Tax=Methylotenera mobilis (strain JLW8 / ATCC BAA-1282 / DSM 17540) TaxID=583345 RepID=C6WXD8_METML|nr:ATP-binding protein [Methylotenera mobilis]ACT48587.1 histidine kinase [Methylotenera mobilis JLW8]